MPGYPVAVVACGLPDALAPLVSVHISVEPGVGEISCKAYMNVPVESIAENPCSLKMKTSMATRVVAASTNENDELGRATGEPDDVERLPLAWFKTVNMVTPLVPTALST